jgi:hypothetical protein
MSEVGELLASSSTTSPGYWRSATGYTPLPGGVGDAVSGCPPLSGGRRTSAGSYMNQTGTGIIPIVWLAAHPVEA